MAERVYNVLFLCTGNSARSVIAESLLAKVGKGRFRAFSAGSFPKGQVHPMAIEVLQSLGFPHEGFRSKSWDEYNGPVLRKWISFSLSAIVLRARPVRSGRGTR